MASAPQVVILDDRLLIEELLVGLPKGRVELHTTMYWYYRASRAAVLGAGGHLSSPFAQLEAAEQERAILTLLNLRADIALPDPRVTGPAMVDVAARHPRLNLLNLEAVAAAKVIAAALWLSMESSAGVLPAILDSEEVAWRTIAIE